MGLGIAGEEYDGVTIIFLFLILTYKYIFL
jgi:hypothetical protein